MPWVWLKIWVCRCHVTKHGWNVGCCWIARQLPAQLGQKTLSCELATSCVCLSETIARCFRAPQSVLAVQLVCSVFQGATNWFWKWCAIHQFRFCIDWEFRIEIWSQHNCFWLSLPRFDATDGKCGVFPSNRCYLWNFDIWVFQRVAWLLWTVEVTVSGFGSQFPVGLRVDQRGHPRKWAFKLPQEVQLEEQRWLFGTGWCIAYRFSGNLSFGEENGKIILGWIKENVQALMMIMNDSKNSCSFTVAVLKCFHHGIAQETEHMKGKNMYTAYPLNCCW